MRSPPRTLASSPTRTSPRRCSACRVSQSTVSSAKASASTVRGTAPNLTRTLFNGHSLATADWFILDQLNTTRSFNYLMLPADIIGQVAVYKTPQADLEEGGIGGTIDVKTRNPLDLESSSNLGLVAGAHTRSSRTRPTRRRPRWFQLEELRRDARRSSSPASTRSARSAATASRCWATSMRIPARPCCDAPSLIGSALFQQERVRTGGNVAVQFRPSDDLEVNLTGLYSQVRRRQHQRELHRLGHARDRQRRHADQCDDRGQHRGRGHDRVAERRHRGLRRRLRRDPPLRLGEHEQHRPRLTTWRRRRRLDRALQGRLHEGRGRHRLRSPSSSSARRRPSPTTCAATRRRSASPNIDPTDPDDLSVHLQLAAPDPERRRRELRLRGCRAKARDRRARLGQVRRQVHRP